MTGVWVGFDSKEVLGKGETGGKAALPIWIDYMKVALGERPDRDFEVPESIVFARVDAQSGLLASPGAPDAYFQAFAEGTEPRANAEVSIDAVDQRSANGRLRARSELASSAACALPAASRQERRAAPPGSPRATPRPPRAAPPRCRSPR